MRERARFGEGKHFALGVATREKIAVRGLTETESRRGVLSRHQIGEICRPSERHGARFGGCKLGDRSPKHGVRHARQKTLLISCGLGTKACPGTRRRR